MPTRFTFAAHWRERLLLLVVVIAGLVTLATWATGGIHASVAGVRLSSSRVLRPFVVAGLAWLALVRLPRRDRASRPLSTPGVTVALAVAALTTFIAFHLAPYAAAADMYGYVAQAVDWRNGSLVHPEWLRERGSFPVATAVPLGYALRSGPDAAAVALYPPGTSLHMAVAALAAPAAMYLVSPLAAVAVVAGTYVVGRRWFGPGEARIAALLTATSPVVLAQAMLPMSDTLAAAYWLAALAVAASSRPWLHIGAGMLAGIAMTVRPNLAPLVLAVSGCSLWSAGPRAAAAVVAGCAPLVAWLGFHNLRLYGSPLATGYGSTGDLFSPAHVAENARNYGLWLAQTMSPLPLLGAAAYAVQATRRRGAGLWLVGFVMLNVALYLAYLPWPHWTFARFLLPAIPILLLMTAAVLIATAGDRRWAVHVIVLVILGWQLQFTHGSELRHTRAALSRFAELPALMQRAGLLEEPVVTRLHSGSLRLYGGARTYRWDHMSPDELRQAVGDARARGRRPLLIDDSDDRAAFEEAFGPTRCWADESGSLVQLERHATVRVLPMRVAC